jgi:Holliday junction resolvase-like predicted endonuclease
MQTITIQVDAEVAQAYQAAEPIKQQQIQQLVNIWLKQTMQQRSLDQIIAEMQTQASQCGLTQELLDTILQDE